LNRVNDKFIGGPLNKFNEKHIAPGLYNVAGTITPSAVEQTISDNSPAANWVEAAIGQTFSGKSLSKDERLAKVEKGFAELSEGLISLGIGRVKTVGSSVPITNAAKTGEFSIINWESYPTNVPKPTGTFRIIEGTEYDVTRRAANNANKALHEANPSLKGMQIHEIKPIKFGGSPTEAYNKIPLNPSEHAKVTTWWRRFQRDLEKR
jgi:hypothetical protein